MISRHYTEAYWVALHLCVTLCGTYFNGKKSLLREEKFISKSNNYFCTFARARATRSPKVSFANNGYFVGTMVRRHYSNLNAIARPTKASKVEIVGCTGQPCRSSSIMSACTKRLASIRPPPPF